MQVDEESSLATEMRGVLPIKLNSIIFSGRGVRILSENVLQGVRSPTFSCVFRNTSITKLTAELFRNAGRARNISVDVRNNFNLQYLQNPSTGDTPGLYRKTFLMELRIAGNNLNCDCDIG